MSDECVFGVKVNLRDYFAGLAMQGDQASYTEKLDPMYEPHLVAMRAYKIADAMLKAREVKSE